MWRNLRAYALRTARGGWAGKGPASSHRYPFLTMRPSLASLLLGVALLTFSASAERRIGAQALNTANGDEVRDRMPIGAYPAASAVSPCWLPLPPTPLTHAAGISRVGCPRGRHSLLHTTTLLQQPVDCL
jgi:hypothetical protein